MGHAVWTFGYPPAKPVEGLAGTGTVAAAIRDEAGLPVLQLADATQIVPGFSGAPLLDVAARRLVGVVVAITEEDQGRLTTTAFAIPAATVLGLVPGLASSDVPAYVALETFSESQTHLFFGRTAAVQRLVGALRRPGTRFLAVLGPSGSGKSSLVRAGLVPALTRQAAGAGEPLRVVVTRPADVGAAVGEASGDGTDGTHGTATPAGMSWGDLTPRRGERVLLVLDQFEEAFVVLAPPRRHELLLSLVHLVESTLPVTVVLVMRDEFFPVLVHEAPGLTRALEEGLRTVPPVLTRTELAEIVTGPATVLGLGFEDGLADRIVDDALTAAPGAEEDTAASIVLPLLEFALTQVWQRRVDGRLTHRAYEDVGKVAGGIAGWAEHALAGFDESMLPVVRGVVVGLVHLGTRTARRRTAGDDDPSPSSW